MDATRFRLWDDEIEALRAETRKKVEELAEVIPDLSGGVPLDTDDGMKLVEAQRQAFEQFIAPSERAVDREIEGLRCRIIGPDSGSVSAVHLHFHGGGMILGRPEMNDLGHEALADQHGICSVSVDYRLAPEHPYPAGLDDCMAVARWVLAHTEAEWGTDRVFIGGESAGGYLAGAALIRLRDEGLVHRVRGGNLVFGVFDWGRSPSQRGLRATSTPDPLLFQDGISLFGECYLPGMSADERRDPAISPAYADLSGLPPLLVSVGTADHLLDDSLILAARAAAAGTEVELVVLPELPHGFQMVQCEMVARWMARQTAWIERVALG